MGRLPLACQLYSVHNSLAKDFEGTVRKVAAAGYAGAEGFGGLNRPVEEVKAILEETGLTLVGWHTGIDAFNDENLKATLTYHRALGTKTLVVPALPREMTATAADWHAVAARFREISRILAEEGMATGFHNHDTEFTPVDGEVPWDILATETGDDFILQIDNGNAMHGGADPLAYLKKYPGRARTFHLKPYSLTKGYDVVPGEDDVPWAETIAELKRQGKTEWVIAEYETEALFPDVEGVRVFCENISKFL